MKPSEAARLTGATEALYQPGVLRPVLTPAFGDWAALGYITGRDAVFGLQKLGLGEAAFYGLVLKRGNEYCVVIRGTESRTEWFENFEAVLQPVTGGAVEAGFYSIYASLRCADLIVAAGIEQLVPAGAQVQVVGHSLGSALATYLCLDLFRLGMDVRGMFFASPRPGNRAYAGFYDAAMFNRYTTYNYLRDVVPRVPVRILPLFDYAQLPNVITLRPADSLNPIPDNVLSNHRAETYALLLEGKSL